MKRLLLAAALVTTAAQPAQACGVPPCVLEVRVRAFVHEIASLERCVADPRLPGCDIVMPAPAEPAAATAAPTSPHARIEPETEE